MPAMTIGDSAGSVVLNKFTWKVSRPACDDTARYVEVAKASPFVRPAVRLICTCGLDHWARAIDGYEDAASIPLRVIADHIARRHYLPTEQEWEGYATCGPWVAAHAGTDFPHIVYRAAVVAERSERRYAVRTFSVSQRAYVRTTLRRALELQPQYNIWAGSEYVYAARELVADGGRLSDEPVWNLTKTELRAVARAIESRRARRIAGRCDVAASETALTDWHGIEEAILRKHQAVSRIPHASD
ncbi:hypothetical protein [Streptomyces sp. CBMA29]|uniref:hypothetical protein n=1 Tax=Streptomyces sp. CBMA29 TaxID=1896314 RepID=UPI001661C1E2|nr:hypothetical protein [Streptomyces sp. CBMA29]MBD0739821.1 hypothetical protein [Streptomyces sp. CBMA29]